MKQLLLIPILILTLNNLPAQNVQKGKVVIEKFLAPSLQGNRGGEDPMRRVTIYLPPGYEDGKKRYPVIYFLYGSISSDSLMMAWTRFDMLMDTAISKSRIHPMIMVLPNSNNNYGGSFYTNSTLKGNWADYITKDLINYIDKKYRTKPDRNSRGLTRHSMGRYGTLKLAMLYPDVFGAAYALSPGAMGWGGGTEFSINNPVFKGIDSFKNEFSSLQITESLMKEGYPEFVKKFYTKLMADLARTYSPNEGKTFISADMSLKFIGDSMVIDEVVKQKWEAQFPINMIESHLPALKSLHALKLDWGRNEEAKHVPGTCLQFSKKLEANGVKHFAEEYIGGHANKQAGTEGRIYTEMLPFFDTYLKFENEVTSASNMKNTK